MPDHSDGLHCTLNYGPCKLACYEKSFEMDRNLRRSHGHWKYQTVISVAWNCNFYSFFQAGFVERSLEVSIMGSLPLFNCEEVSFDKANFWLGPIKIFCARVNWRNQIIRLINGFYCWIHVKLCFERRLIL